MGLSDKVVITAALTGALTMRYQNPNVPHTPEEFAEEAYRCYEAGAAMVHIHARDPETGVPCERVEVLQDIVAAVRARCPILINCSTGVSATATREQRVAVVKATHPDMASLNTNSMNFALANWKTGEILGEIVYSNPFGMMQELGTSMREVGTKPEFECFDTSGVYNVLLLQRQNLFEEPMHFSFVFNVAGGTWYSLDMLTTFTRIIPPGSTWQGIGVGPTMWPVVTTSVANGGHIRVGLEDNIYISKGVLARGSWEQVEKAVRIARELDREPTTIDEAREIYHLKKR